MTKFELRRLESYDEDSRANAETIRRRFGSWWKALETASLPISNLGKRYSEGDYFENLLSVWTHYGRQPSYGEMDRPPSRIPSGAYEVRWGTTIGRTRFLRPHYRMRRRGASP